MELGLENLRRSFQEMRSEGNWRFEEIRRLLLKRSRRRSRARSPGRRNRCHKDWDEFQKEYAREDQSPNLEMEGDRCKEVLEHGESEVVPEGSNVTAIEETPITEQFPIDVTALEETEECNVVAGSVREVAVATDLEVKKKGQRPLELLKHVGTETHPTPTADSPTVTRELGAAEMKEPAQVSHCCEKRKARGARRKHPAKRPPPRPPDWVSKEENRTQGREKSGLQENPTVATMPTATTRTEIHAAPAATGMEAAEALQRHKIFLSGRAKLELQKMGQLLFLGQHLSLPFVLMGLAQQVSSWVVTQKLNPKIALGRTELSSYFGLLVCGPLVKKGNWAFKKMNSKIILDMVHVKDLPRLSSPAGIEKKNLGRDTSIVRLLSTHTTAPHALLLLGLQDKYMLRIIIIICDMDMEISNKCSNSGDHVEIEFLHGGQAQRRLSGSGNSIEEIDDFLSFERPTVQGHKRLSCGYSSFRGKSVSLEEFFSIMLTATKALNRKDMEEAYNFRRIALQVLLVREVNSVSLYSLSELDFFPHVEASNFKVFKDSSLIHSNANLEVHGQGFSNLSGLGHLIEVQHLVLSLFTVVDTHMVAKRPPPEPPDQDIGMGKEEMEWRKAREVWEVTTMGWGKECEMENIDNTELKLLLLQIERKVLREMDEYSTHRGVQEKIETSRRKKGLRLMKSRDLPGGSTLAISGQLSKQTLRNESFGKYTEDGNMLEIPMEMIELSRIGMRSVYRDSIISMILGYLSAYIRQVGPAIVKLQPEVHVAFFHIMDRILYEKDSKPCLCDPPVIYMMVRVGKTHAENKKKKLMEKSMGPSYVVCLVICGRVTKEIHKLIGGEIDMMAVRVRMRDMAVCSISTMTSSTIDAMKENKETEQLSECKSVISSHMVICTGVMSIALATIVDNNGSSVKISIYDDVGGDVVPLTIGNQALTKGIGITGHSFAIDESSLTGGSKIVHKSLKEPFLLAVCKVAFGRGSTLETWVGNNTEWRHRIGISKDNGGEKALQVCLNGVATLTGITGLSVAILDLMEVNLVAAISESSSILVPFNSDNNQGRLAVQIVFAETLKYRKVLRSSGWVEFELKKKAFVALQQKQSLFLVFLAWNEQAVQSEQHPEEELTEALGSPLELQGLITKHELWEQYGFVVGSKGNFGLTFSLSFSCWDPGGYSYFSATTWSTCFQQWDPGGGSYYQNCSILWGCNTLKEHSHHPSLRTRMF